MGTRAQLCSTLWDPMRTLACRTPLLMEFSRLEWVSTELSKSREPKQLGVLSGVLSLVHSWVTTRIAVCFLPGWFFSFLFFITIVAYLEKGKENELALLLWTKWFQAKQVAPLSLHFPFRRRKSLMTILEISCYCGDDKKAWCESKLFWRL